MDETQISITIKPMYIERLIYWIIIIVLAVLLIMSYMKDDDAPSSTTTSDTKTTQTAAPQAQPEPEAPAAKATDTCTDAKLNGDETDVDCGGKCGVKCASGKACLNNSDCVSGYCTNKACTNTAPTTLSGKLEIDVTKAAYTEASSGAVKVTGISYTIKNGLAEDLAGGQIKIFLKSKSNTGCLNQGTDDGCDKEFARFVVPRVASGKNFNENHELQKDEYTSGSFVQKDEMYYDYEDSSRSSFNVVAYLYDANGDLIDGKTYSDSVLVDP
jgi:hypothetical protein